MKKAVTFSLALSLLFLTPSLVLAETTKNSGESGNPSVKSVFRTEVKQKVEEVKQKTCETRMDNIQKRSDQLSQRAASMEENFGGIATKVESFYTEKLVSAGTTVSNYDALVADIANKKAAVDSALADAKSKATSFDCTNVQTAKTWVTDYRQAMQKVIAALKDYKTSIKNLIVAVRGVAVKVKPSSSPKSN